MNNNLLKTTLTLSLLPARMAIFNTKASIRMIQQLPEMLKDLAAGKIPQTYTGERLQRLLDQIDAELGDIENTSPQERQVMFQQALDLARMHIGEASRQCLKAGRIATCGESRVIDGQTTNAAYR